MDRKRRRRIFLIAAAALALLWIAGNLLVDVQFEENDAGRNSLLPHKSASLREVFEALPAAGAGKFPIGLLDDNMGAWAARWRLLAGARRDLEVSYFILNGDIFGISFLGHLLHKAREGTRIRILLDAIGTTLSREIRGNDYLDSLAGTGNVEVKIYRPYLFRLRDAFLTLNPAALLVSDHDKILIADRRRALIGGRNIAREYLAGPEDYALSFRDADVLLENAEMSKSLEAVFSEGFRSAKARDVRSEMIDLMDSGADLLLAYEAMDAWLRGRQIPEKTGSAIGEKGFRWIEDLEKLPRLRGALRKKSAPSLIAEVRLLDSRPRLFKSNDPVTRSLVRLAQSARRDIFVMTPYLILSPEAVSVFEQAAARGVRITILTNGPLSSDNALSQAIFLEQWPELMARVPGLRLFVAGDRHNIHAKLGAIDGSLSLVGTYNLDPFSMGLNSEVAVAVWSTRFAAQLLERPRRFIAGGPPGVYEYTIKRDEYGRAERDRDGKPAIAFGPEHHSSHEAWSKVHWYRKLVRLAEALPGTSGLFRQ